MASASISLDWHFTDVDEYHLECILLCAKLPEHAEFCCASSFVDHGAGIVVVYIYIYSAFSNSGEVEWVPSDVNKGHLAAFFFLLAGIMLSMTAGFMVQAKRYKPKVLMSVEGSE